MVVGDRIGSAPRSYGDSESDDASVLLATTLPGDIPGTGPAVTIWHGLGRPLA